MNIFLLGGAILGAIGIAHELDKKDKAKSQKASDSDEKGQKLTKTAKAVNTSTIDPPILENSNNESDIETPNDH